jgi:signal transduction histidine kinase
LGLAIGRELAERMGGELVLEDHEGPGAKFTLRLPVAHAPEEEPIGVG